MHVSAFADASAQRHHRRGHVVGGTHEDSIETKGASRLHVLQQVACVLHGRLGGRDRRKRRPGKAVSRGAQVALGGAAAVAAAKITGKKTRANPVASGVTSAVGSIATDLAGPIVGRFVRHLIGGLMR